MELLVNTARLYIDNNIQRSSEYLIYKNPIQVLSPVEFANIIHRIYMILYLSIDIEDKDSIYNIYCDNFMQNLSTKLIEELYIRCLKDNKKNMDDYIDYIVKVVERLIELKSEALMTVFIEFGINCPILDKVYNALIKTPDTRMSPVKPIKEAFADFDDIEDVKYYIYKTDIKEVDIPKIRYEDIRLVFDYLNIPVIYQLHHHGENCIKKKCDIGHKDLKIITENLSVESDKLTSSSKTGYKSKSSGRTLSAFLSSLIKTPKEKTPSKSPNKTLR